MEEYWIEEYTNSNFYIYKNPNMLYSDFRGIGKIVACGLKEKEHLVGSTHTLIKSISRKLEIHEFVALRLLGKIC